MGRGCGWSDTELAHLCRAWIYASEDAITGIDQTASRFKETLFEKFVSFAPGDTSEKSYDKRTAKAVRAKFDEVAAYVQKFRDALRVVCASKPTGVTQDEILSMAIAKHLGKRYKMSYDARTYPHNRWKNHLAYKVLRVHPKFSDEGTGAKTAHADTIQSPPNVADAEHDALSDHVQNSVQGTEAQQVASTSSLASTPHGADVLISSGSSIDKPGGRPVGRKSQLRLRANDKFRENAMKNGESIAESLRRRTDLMEEKNAILAYARDECENSDDLADRAEFFRLVRKQHFKRLRERLAEGEERFAASPRLSVGEGGTSDPSASAAALPLVSDGTTDFTSATMSDPPSTTASGVASAPSTAPETAASCDADHLIE